MPKKYSTLTVLVALLVSFEKIEVSEGIINTRLDQKELDVFFNVHFHFLNEISNELGLSEDERKPICKRPLKALPFLIPKNSGWP